MFGSHMNPQRGRHMGGGENEGGAHGEQKPHVFVHSHSGGHTVHLFHSDGRHEMQEHGHDADSAADHVRESLGGGNNEGEMNEHDEDSGSIGG